MSSFTPKQEILGGNALPENRPDGAIKQESQQKRGDLMIRVQRDQELTKLALQNQLDPDTVKGYFKEKLQPYDALKALSLDVPQKQRNPFMPT